MAPIKRLDGKETKQYGRQEYEAVLVGDVKLHTDRIGELVIDIGTAPSFPSLWVANVTGHLNPVGGAGGGFGQITVDGQTLDALANPAVGIEAANVQHCGYVRKTVGIELVQPTPTESGRIEFRVTPTGVPIDNPFSANADFGMAVPDFATLGDEIGAYWVWDLQKNPLAGLQCYDLGLLP
jgi:hypothetical protein